MMPHMTGSQLASRLAEEWSDLQVIVTTGFAEDDAESRKWPTLRKPFSQDDLAEQIVQVKPPAGSDRVVPFRNGKS